MLSLIFNPEKKLAIFMLNLKIQVFNKKKRVCVETLSEENSSVVTEKPHLILLQVKLDYIPDILPQTGCPEKVSFRLLRGSKLARSGIFAIFFGFSKYLF